jgi:molybdopterin converting factor small subunit
MRVTVDSNMTIYGVFQPPIEVNLKGEKSTLRALLEELARLCASVEFINGDELGNDIQTVLVNDKEHYYLNTNLNDGDKVMVMVEMAPLGGG